MIRYLILTGLLLCMLAGCNDEQEQMGDVPGILIRLNADVKAPTKVSASAFDEADRIGVFVAQYNSDQIPQLKESGNYADNHLFVYTGNALVTDRELYYPVKNNVDIYGYYPYTDDIVSIDKFPVSVPVDQPAATDLKAADFVWAKRANVAANNSVVSLSFAHRMSKLVVSVEVGTEIDDLTGMTINYGGLVCSGTVNLQTGIASPSDTARIYRMTPVPLAGATTVKKEYEAIIIPQAVNAGTLLVEVELDGKKYSYRAPEGGQIFGSGKVQRLELVVNAYQRGLQLKSATVKDWVSNGDGIIQQIVPDVDGREVLMALYDATGGPSWTQATNWGSAEALTEWYGVTVEDNEVVAIELPHNNLVGTLPADLGKLTRLQKLNLQGNQLKDTLSISLGKVATLTQLNLSNNLLTGKIPASFGDLRNLTRLSLHHNHLSGSVPRRVTLLSAYQADSVLVQLDDSDAVITLEIEGEEAMTGEKYIGDLNFKDQAEINTFAARGYTEILGNMTIASDISNIPVFTGLKKIHGNLDGYNNSSFPDLTYVGGNLTGKDENWTEENTDKLMYIGGNLSIHNSSSEVAGFNGLIQVNDISIYADIVNGFHNLVKAGSVSLQYCSIIQGFDNLTQVEDMSLYRVDMIPEFPKLKTVENSFSIDNNQYKNLVFNTCNALETVGGDFYISSQNYSGTMELQGFNSLKSVGYDFKILGNQLLAIPEFPALETVVRRFIINSSSLSRIAGFNKLTSCAYITIYGDALNEIDGFNDLVKVSDGLYSSYDGLSITGTTLTKISGFTKFKKGNIKITAPLTEISDFSAWNSGSLTLSGTQLTDISGFNAADSVTIELSNNTKLKDISGFRSFTGNKYDRSSLSISGNTLLENITGLTSLTKLYSLTVSGCYSLVTLPFVDRLTALDYSLTIENNFSLTTIPAFQSGVMLPNLTVRGNTVLEDYTALQSVIDANTEVTVENNKYNPTKEDILAGKVKPE